MVLSLRDSCQEVTWRMYVQVLWLFVADDCLILAAISSSPEPEVSCILLMSTHDFLICSVFQPIIIYFLIFKLSHIWPLGPFTLVSALFGHGAIMFECFLPLRHNKLSRFILHFPYSRPGIKYSPKDTGTFPWGWVSLKPNSGEQGCSLLLEYHCI